MYWKRHIDENGWEAISQECESFGREDGGEATKACAVEARDWDDFDGDGSGIQ